MQYPPILATSVLRGAKPGDIHGRAYYIDLNQLQARELVTWDDPSLATHGRGRDRGLRGIAAWNDCIFIATSRTIRVYDRSLKLVEIVRNPYLHNLHEIAVDGSHLYITSTGFNSILVYDLESKRFAEGLWLEANWLFRQSRRLGVAASPRLVRFNPDHGAGPRPGGSHHINTVCPRDDKIFVSGTRMRHCLAIDGNRIERHRPIPPLTHNAQPYRDGVLFNDTANARIVYSNGDGDHVYRMPTFQASQLKHTDVPSNVARIGFVRGLAVSGDGIVGGTSPATISGYQRDQQQPMVSLNISMDIRETIHGLVISPFELENSGTEVETSPIPVDPAAGE